MRISTASTYRRVLLGIRQNQLRSFELQDQLASGKRVRQVSDDPTAASRASRLERQLGDLGRFREAIAAGERTLGIAGAALNEGASLLADARELLIQGMNGTLSDKDRGSIAIEFDLIRSELMQLGNTRAGELYVFGGTSTDSPPWREVQEGGTSRVVYEGDGESLGVRVGVSIEAEITLSGLVAFGQSDPSGVRFGGLTGATSGITADQGEGFAKLHFRHDSTAPGALGSVGIALVNGGDDDTILGDNAITVDASAGSIQLGSGKTVFLSEAVAGELVVENELGGKLHLDVSGFTGVDYSGTVTGNGSVSLDGSTYETLTFTETDLELRDPAAGTIVHVDATAVKRAGNETIEFGGTANVFDLLQTIAEELRNPEGMDTNLLFDRLGDRLTSLDGHHQKLLESTGVLGARSARLEVSDQRSSDVEVELQTLLSHAVDADFAELATEMAQSEFLLQIAQASGARLMQTSLLNYLG